jgi:hypothetical protein
MSMIESTKPPSEVAARAERALRLPMGVASPLWLLYAGAAGAGLAYWWMTRWAKPANLEALMGAGKSAVEGAVEATAPAAEAVVAAAETAEETLETAVEQAVEAAPPLPEAEPLFEAAPEPAPPAFVAPEPPAAAAEPEPQPPVLEAAPQEKALSEALSLTPPPEISAKPKAAAPRRPRATSAPRRD